MLPKTNHNPRPKEKIEKKDQNILFFYKNNTYNSSKKCDIKNPRYYKARKNQDYFIVRIFKSRVRAGEILLTRGNGNFLATGF